VAEGDGEVVFLHRILPGGADRSYGVHVGRLAGLPKPVINRAWELLEQLESGHQHEKGRAAGARGRRAARQEAQLPLISPGSEAVAHLLKIDVDSLTPMEAITKLYELKKKAQDDGAARSG